MSPKLATEPRGAHRTRDKDSLAARVGVGVRPGTVVVPVADGALAAGPAVNTKSSAPSTGRAGLTIDDDRVAPARDGVDEDHAPIVGREAGVAPRREHHDHRPQ